MSSATSPKGRFISSSRPRSTTRPGPWMSMTSQWSPSWRRSHLRRRQPRLRLAIRNNEPEIPLRRRGVELLVQAELNGNFDRPADGNATNGSSLKLPAFDGPHCGLIEQDVAGTFLDRQGFDSTLRIQPNAQDNGPLLSHPSCFERIDRWRVIAVARIAPSRTSAATSSASGTRAGHTTPNRARAMNGAASARIQIGVDGMWLRGFGRRRGWR